MDAYFYLTDKGDSIYQARREAIAAERPTLRAEQDGLILSRLGNSGPETYYELRDHLLERRDSPFDSESTVQGSLRRLFEAGYVGFD